jgi:oxygen-independent coproporphyrinogen III oxidase
MRSLCFNTETMFIYVHMPFCLSHCIYCDFYVALKATEDRRRAYLNALKQEIRFYLGQQENPLVRTIYFGGGTPALFSAEEIQEVLVAIENYAIYAPETEITLEANPEGMRSEAGAYREIGINRLSIGIQSLQPNELKRLSRIHSRDQAIQTIQKVRQAGFENISIDLMYGIPEQTHTSWQNTLEQTIDLGLEHISMYGLKVEPETGLAKLIDQGRMSLPQDDETVDFYEQGISVLENNDFRRYEISNLAKPGRSSQHNLNYWHNGEFWGFGVSAHGYIQAHRYENPRDLEAYLTNPTQRTTMHFCSPQERLENAFIFGLRTSAGVSIPSLEQAYGFDFEACYGPPLKPYFEAGFLTMEASFLKLSPKAISVSNEILAIFLGPS